MECGWGVWIGYGVDMEWGHGTSWLDDVIRIMLSLPVGGLLEDRPKHGLILLVGVAVGEADLGGRGGRELLHGG
jgi:hypothetical protein